MPWETILKDFGFPTLVVVAVAIFFWKGFWPAYTKSIDSQKEVLINQLSLAHATQKEYQANIVAMHAVHQEQLSEERRTHQTLMQTTQGEFMKALERRDEKFGEIVEAMENLKEEIRDGKRIRAQ